MRNIVAGILLGLSLLPFQISQAGQIDLQSLLEQMLDRADIAEFPEPEFVCRQASSCNRRSKTPGTADWFAGADFDQFYGCDRRAGRDEWIMLDVDGPGAVTRWWQTQYRGAGTIRIYLDGAEAPIFAGTGDELIGGRAITGPPFAAVCGGGRNLYLPIPFGRHCKITFESPSVESDFTHTSPAFTNHSLFYIINYMQYAEGTPVKTLTRSDLQANEALIARAGRALLHPQDHVLAIDRTIQGGTERLGPGQSMIRSIEGPGAICRLRLRLDAGDMSQALRSTVVSADFDGKQTVWAPFGEFFGSGLGLNPYQTWWRQVEKDGWMTCWWPMPFRESATVRVTNCSTTESVDLAFDDLGIAAWDWTNRTMTFHTAWRGENLKQFVGDDFEHMEAWNYLTLDGRGVYVGDSLSLYNRPRIHWTDGRWIGPWWGEGDEKIWVDGDTFPSHFGTGSEDYFGYAFNHTRPFHAPFHAQPIARGNWGIGHTTNVRVRVHDRIPFKSRLKFDMELFHWQPKRKIDYAATTHWYAFDGAVDNGMVSLERVREKVAQAPDPGLTAAELPAEGPLDPFLGEPNMAMQQVFSGDRFPSVVVATDGTVLAFWNGVIVRRSEDGGRTWGDEIQVGRGFMGGGVTVDENTGDILAFVEASHPPAEISVYRSTDQGKIWRVQDTVIHSDRDDRAPSMHMNEHGITLRHGRYAGRLVRPTRWYAGKNDRALWPQHYTNAIYSDDGGRIWHTSDPFPANGTGEAAVVELSDGRIYYNSRRHWAPEGVNPRRRWTAWSDNGGQTWNDLAICEVLPDGDQVRDYGLMGGLVRLPVRGRDILVFSNIESDNGRHHGTVWASFDGGRTWPIKRLVYEGPFAYSSLNAGRPSTPAEGWIYLLFEGGPAGGGTLARFNLSWLLQGDKTGHGELPGWTAAQATVLP